MINLGFHSRILQGLSDCSPFVKVTLMERHRSIWQFKYLKFCIFFVHNICVTGLCSLKQSQVYHRGVAIWNSLPQNLCSINRLSNFKISF